MCVATEHVMPMLIIDGQAVDAAPARQRFVSIPSAFRNLFVPSHPRRSAFAIHVHRQRAMPQMESRDHKIGLKCARNVFTPRYIKQADNTAAFYSAISVRTRFVKRTNLPYHADRETLVGGARILVPLSPLRNPRVPEGMVRHPPDSRPQRNSRPLGTHELRV